jgi:hypothetical protein
VLVLDLPSGFSMEPYQELCNTEPVQMFGFCSGVVLACGAMSPDNQPLFFFNFNLLS